MNDLIRHCIFKPYRKGQGPIFHLYLFDNGQTRNGKSVVGYELVKRETGIGYILFQGTDFCCSPLHAIDSDETVKALMGLLTLKPGDTDREYFAEYNATQLEFCASHAESLAAEVERRFPE